MVPVFVSFQPNLKFQRHYALLALLVRHKTLLPITRGVLAQNFVVLWKNRGAGKNHSERRACITSTRAARAAGSIEATTAAPNSTNAETIAGHAPGIFRSPK